jgi:hypothetical protein
VPLLRWPRPGAWPPYRGHHDGREESTRGLCRSCPQALPPAPGWRSSDQADVAANWQNTPARRGGTTACQPHRPPAAGGRARCARNWGCARYVPVRTVTYGDSRSVMEQPALLLTCAATGPASAATLQAGVRGSRPDTGEFPAWSAQVPRTTRSRRGCRPRLAACSPTAPGTCCWSSRPTSRRGSARRRCGAGGVAAGRMQA